MERITRDQLKACVKHAKAIGLKVDWFESKETALAFLMKDAKTFSFCFDIDSKFGTHISVEYFISNKQYHSKLTVGAFLKLNPNHLNGLQMMAQTANEEAELYAKMLKSLPQRHKGDVETVFKLAATNGSSY